MTTTTFTTGAGAITSSLTSTLKEDGTVDEKGRNSLIGASVATTATAAAGALINQKTMKEIYEKYSTSYIDSMTDEQLATALTELDLLEARINNPEGVKTI